jgi:hypothetical protein
VCGDSVPIVAFAGDVVSQGFRIKGYIGFSAWFHVILENVSPILHVTAHRAVAPLLLRVHAKSGSHSLACGQCLNEEMLPLSKCLC